MQSGRLKILVTGANGQLGMEFRELKNKERAIDFHFVSREQLPINDSDKMESFFSAHQFDYCINCAAYTAVDKAESEKELAIEINATAVGNLARLCKKYDSRLIHFSTDYVFDGLGKEPYEETDTTSPVNFYGQTKLEGERAALAANDSVTIIRTSWVYSQFGRNFVKTMKKLMQEKDAIGVVKDQFGSPTYAADLAQFTLNIVQGNLWQPGIYHYCNHGVISWYHFAATIRDMIGSGCTVNAISTAEFPTPAKRPSYSALSTQKIEQTFGEPMKEWKESLQRCLNLLS